MEHDVEVFNRMDGLERLPILKPHDRLRRHSRTKGPLDILLDRLPRLVCQIVRGRVIRELELGPDHQMNNVGVDAVRPVIVQDPNVLYTSWLAVCLGYQHTRPTVELKGSSSWLQVFGIAISPA